MRQRIVAANWKMYKNSAAVQAFIQTWRDTAPSLTQPVVINAPFPFLSMLCDAFHGDQHLAIGAQNCHQELEGAYTGETSVNMLQSIGVQYVIIGHSERRQYFKEDDALLALKTRRVLDAGIRPIFCCGETLDVREANQHFALVEKQLKDGLFAVPAAEIQQCVIAYEPVWAIGTGVTASPEQAQEMHAHIRSLLTQQYGESIAQSMTIQYGGSVKPNNAAELFSKPDVDGALVGGASLQAEDFIAIIKAIQ